MWSYSFIQYYSHAGLQLHVQIWKALLTDMIELFCPHRVIQNMDRKLQADEMVSYVI